MSRPLRILFHNCRLLHPLNGGDRIRTYQMLRELRREHHVTYLCLRTPADTAEAIERADEYCQELISVEHPVKNRRSVRFHAEVLWNTLFGRYPYLAAKYRAPAITRELKRMTAAGLSRGFDLVVCDYLAPMVNLLALERRASMPMLLFQHNVESTIFERHARTTRNPIKAAIYARQWRKVEEFEREAGAFVDAQVAVSEEDAAAFRRLGMRNVLGAVPTGVDCDYFQPVRNEPGGAPILAFLGSMDWEANQDAVQWFVHDIWPGIRREIPEAEFVVIGRNPSPGMRALASADSRIRLTGTVEDVRPELGKARAMVLPLRIGGGTRIKIYEAMAMGVPVISTRIGAEGLDVTHERNIVLADAAADFAREAVVLLSDEERARAIAAEARRHVETRYSWQRACEVFVRYCYETIERSRERTAN